ncbi:hypothetical protein CLAIMM_05582, partial [Cladophialophora immunda]
MFGTQSEKATSFAVHVTTRTWRTANLAGMAHLVSFAGSLTARRSVARSAVPHMAFTVADSVHLLTAPSTEPQFTAELGNCRSSRSSPHIRSVLICDPAKGP